MFVGGRIGVGWQKTVYGDALKAMYTYDSSIKKFDDGSVALCTGEPRRRRRCRVDPSACSARRLLPPHHSDVEKYGGFDFHSHNPKISTFSEAKAIEFWAQTGAGGVPDMAFRVANLMRASVLV